MSKKKILAIIPARAGSKRLKNKNLLKIKNKPLIYYTISKALKSKLIDYTLVTTDSLKIAKVSKKYGASVPFLRPKKLSSDKTDMLKVLKHSINFLKKKKLFFEYIILMQPTSPLRKISKIDKIINFFIRKRKKINSLCTLSLSKPKEWIGNLNKSNQMQNFKSTDHRKYKNYALNGSIYIFRTNYLMKLKKLNFDKSYGYVIDKKFSIDIDYLYQFKICKLIIEKNEKYFL